MQIKNGVLSGRRHRPHPAAHQDVDDTVGSALQRTAGSVEIDLSQARAIVDGPGRQRAGTTVHRGITLGNEKAAAGIPEHGRKLALGRRIVVPVWKRKAVVTCHPSADTLKPVEIHAVPGPEKVIAMLTCIPGCLWRSGNRSVDRGL